MPMPEDNKGFDASNRLLKHRESSIDDDFANDFSKISMAKWHSWNRPGNLRQNPIHPIIEVASSAGKENRRVNLDSPPSQPNQDQDLGQSLNQVLAPAPIHPVALSYAQSHQGSNAKALHDQGSSRTFSNAMNKFTLMLQIGRGAFATVYKAENKATKQVLAIKQIRLDPSDDVEAMMGEIDLLKILNHHNIVKYYGFVKTPLVLNILLEYCSGGLLRLRYRQLGHGFSEPKTAQYTRLILEGLRYLHAQGVVHRDIKAANVLITHDGEIKLADFGVATSICAQHATLVGTPNWIAPEIILGGERLCTASDIWLVGATVIELLTTFPPYHDLNSMAALHAIVVDDFPPIPPCLAQCRSFLLDCFQKLPLLRPSADVLLKHRWLRPSDSKDDRRSNGIGKTDPHIVKATNDNLALMPPRRPISEFYEDEQEQNQDWEHEFSQANPQHHLFSQKRDFLKEYAESGVAEEWNNLELSQNLQPKAALVINHGDQSNTLNEDTDPFASEEFADFDTAEVKVQAKLAALTAKLSGCTTSLHHQNAGAAEASTSLVKRILYIITKNPELLDVLVRDHGVLTFLEMLGTAHYFPQEQRLWLYVLATLNCIFVRSTVLFESFCLLGGIPCVTQFASLQHGSKVRVQVARFINLFCNSNPALHMFVSCGGIAVLSRMLALDAQHEPAVIHALLVKCIFTMLQQDLAHSKSDLCWILSKHGILHWLMVLLCIKVLNGGGANSKETVEHIMAIIVYFSNSEARVRRNICTSDLLSQVVRAFPHLSFNHQLVILKFFKLVLCVPQLLAVMYKAGLLGVLVQQLHDHPPTSANFQEVVNIVCPTLYNCCYLSHEREIEIVKLGVVPLYARLAQLPFSFRQFVLPLLCEFARCGSMVQSQLLLHGVREIYFELLLDPYWQASALDAIVHWDQHNPAQAGVDSATATASFADAFLVPKVSNMESVLDSFLQVAVRHVKVARIMVERGIYTTILERLDSQHKNTVLQLALLRLLKVLVGQGLDLAEEKDLKALSQITSHLEESYRNSGLVLVSQLVSEILGTG